MTLQRIGRKALVTLVCCVAALAAQARSFDDIKKDGKIIIATEGQFAPFNFFRVRSSPVSRSTSPMRSPPRWG